MVQFLSINFFSWISSIFVGFFNSSRFLCHSVFEMPAVSSTAQDLSNKPTFSVRKTVCDVTTNNMW